ncbi:MAG: adenylate/guanylate cyclase domain-containing protein [Flavobacteriales bacterium]
MIRSIRALRRHVRCALLLSMLPVGLDVRGQGPTLNGDSLYAIWNDGSRPDTVRFAALQQYAHRFFYGGNPDSLLQLGRQLMAFAAAHDLKKHEAMALDLIAGGFTNKGDFDSSEHYLLRSAHVFETLHDDRNLSVTLNNLGNAVSARGDLAQAIEYLTRSLRINESLGDSSGMARALGNIGVMYHMQEDYVNAMDYYQRRVLIAEAIGDKQCASEAYGNMAIIQQEQGDTALALAGYRKSVAVSRELADSSTLALNLVNIGRLLAEGGDFAGASVHFQEGLMVSERIGEKWAQAGAHEAMGTSFFEQGDLRQALREGTRALELARDVGDVSALRDVAFLLFKVHKARGSDMEALKMHEFYISLRDSVLADENKQEIMSQRFQYDYDKKAVLMQAEQDKKDAVAAEELRRKNLQRNAFIGGFGLMVLLAGVFFVQRNRINVEKKRSEELLLNILPEEVAEELKAKGSAEAVHIDQVTVLFTDFKGFTAMSEVLSPRDLVRDLNECFSAFDHITSKYGIEKIKTIGDAYMAAGGLPTPNTTHATDVIKAALEMRDFIAEGKARKIAAGLPYFEIRIGIHTGPVVAGIVGVKKFQYDIWGDTVNTASRMESSGEVGQVNISEATYALVKDVNGEWELANGTPAPSPSHSPFTSDHSPAFTFTPRGKVQAKGKGEMEMYFVSSA